MADWIRCPVYAQYTREHWVPRDRPWTPHMLLGIAIGDGLSECYRHWDDPNPPEYGLPVALKVLEAGYQETSEWTLAGLTKLVTRGLQAAVEEDAPRGHPILRIDESIGVSRPDLICRAPDGLEIIDTKISLTVDARYRAQRLAEYDTDFKTWHYAWEVEQFYGEPVARTGIHQIILSPRPVSTLYPVPVTRERLAFWLRMAEQLWQDRGDEDAGRCPRIPRMASCHTKYGLCDFYAACHEFGGDPGRMGAYYERGER